MALREVFASPNCPKAKIWMERSGIAYLLLYSHLKDDEERSDEELSSRYIDSAEGRLEFKGRGRYFFEIR